jgi:hypothetical protein
MITALLFGESRKRDGTFRQWNCAEYHGDTQHINSMFMLQVVEHGHIKQVNMSTFIGRILLDDKEMYIFFGEIVSYENYDVLMNLPF